MTAAGERAALERLAALYGVQTEYLDWRKERIQARTESLIAVLRGLGAPVERMSDVPAAIAQRERETWCRHVEPVLVAWDGALPSVELRLPAAEATGDVEYEVALEGGGTQIGRIGLLNASVSQKANLGDHEYTALLLRIDLTLPPGYHELTLRFGGHELRSLVIAAPLKAYAAPDGREWGVFLPLYALYSRRSWGIGDFTDLRRLVDWAAGQGAGFVGTLPLLASFLENEPYAPSPYQPVSRLFWNEIFIDVEAAFTEMAGNISESVAVPAATAKAARDLNAREAVPYREAMALKRRALTEITRRKDQGPAANGVASRQAARPAHADYAAFRAALVKLGPRWREWPSPQRSGSLTDADCDADTASFYAFAQGTAASQMAQLSETARQRGARLYLDLPVGVHPDGYDAWRYQDQFVEKMSAGAPPDAFAPQGQDWGFQPLNPNAVREQGYNYVRAYLRHHLEAAGLLRIDHAIGLHRLFWIPEGASGAEGVFVRQPSEELYAVLSLESHRAQSVVIGENLGLVPPEVNQGMARHGIGEMYVQTFAMTGDARRPLRAPKPGSIASFGTHDLAPFAAFWTDEDLAERVRIGAMDSEMTAVVEASRSKGKRALSRHLASRGLAGLGTARDAYLGTTRLLAESRARWATLSLEDAWGETRPQNIPGTIEEQHANWSRRATYGLEEFASLDDITEVFDVMRSVRGRKETRDDQ
jgi:4-alpha-glucanotransferase